jgi:hypothetical protein
MNEFIARWTSDSPAFFKAISKFGKWLVAAGAAIIATNMAAPEIISKEILAFLEKAAGYMVFGGGIIVAISNLTVSDYEELKDKLND